MNSLEVTIIRYSLLIRVQRIAKSIGMNRAEIRKYCNGVIFAKVIVCRDIASLIDFEVFNAGCNFSHCLL